MAFNIEKVELRQRVKQGSKFAFASLAITTIED